MNPYRSVNGGWSLVNRVAVESLGAPFLELVKKLPRFCLESRTVGGRLSSGTMDASSTLGGGSGPLTSEELGVTAVVGVRELGLLSRAGRFGGLAASSIPIAALEREIKLRPAATAPDTTSPPSGSFRAGGPLDTLAARERARCRPGGSFTLMSSSRALLTSACAHSASFGCASPYKIEPVSGVRIRCCQLHVVNVAYRSEHDCAETRCAAPVSAPPRLVLLLG